MKENYTLDPKISPLYQYIRDFSQQTVPSGAGDANYSELFCLADYAVIHFTKLMKAYEI
jgi:hypothetical protein